MAREGALIDNEGRSVNKRTSNFGPWLEVLMLRQEDDAVTRLPRFGEA